MFDNSYILFETAINMFLDAARCYGEEFRLSDEDIENAKSLGPEFVIPATIKNQTKYIAITKVAFGGNEYPIIDGFDVKTGKNYEKIYVQDNTDSWIAVAKFLSYITANIF